MRWPEPDTPGRRVPEPETADNTQAAPAYEPPDFDIYTPEDLAELLGPPSACAFSSFGP